MGRERLLSVAIAVESRPSTNSRPTLSCRLLKVLHPVPGFVHHESRYAYSKEDEDSVCNELHYNLAPSIVQRDLTTGCGSDLCAEMRKTVVSRKQKVRLF
jgi:hypothetical protein